MIIANIDDCDRFYSGPVKTAIDFLRWWIISWNKNQPHIVIDGNSKALRNAIVGSCQLMTVKTWESAQFLEILYQPKRLKSRPDTGCKYSILLLAAGEVLQPFFQSVDIVYLQIRCSKRINVSS